MIASSPELLQFYKDWLNWAKYGAMSWNVRNFSKHFGLCWKAPGHLKKEMKEQFRQAELHDIYPFGYEGYHRANHQETQHLDPNRIAWVESRIKDMEQ